jgi:multidrug efflux pump subunit AcrA (membrane-fusion protein)
MKRLLTLLLTMTLMSAAGCASGNSEPVRANGTVETTQVNLSPEVGGRVVEALAQEGEQVKEGQVLVRLDDTLLQAQLRQAEASLKAAQANYDLLAAGPTKEQLRQAQAALDAAQANYDLLAAGPTAEQLRQAEASLVIATANYSRTVEGSRPADIDAAQAAYTAALSSYNKVKAGPEREDYALAEANFRNAEAALRKAQSDYDRAYAANPAGIGASPAALALEQATNNFGAAKSQYDKVAKVPDNAIISAAYQQLQSARAALDRAKRPSRSFDVEQAVAQVETARAQLDALKAGARAQQLDAAKAQVASAQAQLDALKAGARAQQLDVLKAQTEAAQAAVDALQAQIKKLALIAPVDGILLTRSVEEGEVAAPGAVVLTLARLDNLTLTVYVPEDRYGEVRLDQPAQVTVDSFPGERFNAVVRHIASKAEFTPRNVQTNEGRRTTVFAVKLAVSDSSGRLKPGMPADVVFSSQ